MTPFATYILTRGLTRGFWQIIISHIKSFRMIRNRFYHSFIALYSGETIIEQVKCVFWDLKCIINILMCILGRFICIERENTFELHWKQQRRGRRWKCRKKKTSPPSRWNVKEDRKREWKIQLCIEVYEKKLRFSETFWNSSNHAKFWSRFSKFSCLIEHFLLFTYIVFPKYLHSNTMCSRLLQNFQ